MKENQEQNQGLSREEIETNEKKEERATYRDVHIEAVISDVQSFYYFFENMYVSDYIETLSTEDGNSTYTFTLRERKGSETHKIGFKLKKAQFTDKVSKGFKVLLNAIFDHFGLSEGGSSSYSTYAGGPDNDEKD